MHRTRGLTVRAIVGGTVNSNISNFLWNAPKQCGALVICASQWFAESNKPRQPYARTRIPLAGTFLVSATLGSPHPRAEIKKRRNWIFF